MTKRQVATESSTTGWWLKLYFALREHHDRRRLGWQALHVMWRARARLLGRAVLPDLSGAPEEITAAQRAADAADLSFHLAGTPVLSIVIPVYNNWLYTKRCLGSLCAQAAIGTCEIIVVDDGSTDHTRRGLRRIRGIRVHRNSENLGFTHAANRGARAARGRYVMFLNNDTVVMPGCLGALLATMADEGIGAAGAKLLYPNGYLQEAGALVWSDGTGWNIGRGASAESADYLFRRDVDYASAAALVVRADLLRSVGYFDTRFAPGYYEDADLCFAIRQRGFRVVYEPSAVVVHMEGMTFGSERGLGIHRKFGKESQEQGRKAFAAKWHDELAEHSPPRQSRVIAEVGGSARRPLPRILVGEVSMPAPDRDAGSNRIDWIMRLLLERSSRLTLALMDDAPASLYGEDLRRAGVELVTPAAKPLPQLLAERAGLYDIAFLSRRPVAEAWMEPLRRHQPHAAIIFDMVDLESLRLERQRAVVGHPDESVVDDIRRRDEGVIAQADLTAAVTAAEAAAVEKLHPGARVVVLPTVHPMRAADPPPVEARRDLLFIGNFNHAPNCDAVQWMLAKILPIIRETLDLELIAVGPDVPATLTRSAGTGVVFSGWQPDLQPILDSARVFVAPIRFGAGMKGKIGQALSYGLPVVTTSLGAEGMDLVDGLHALIRDDEYEFAKAVIDIYVRPELWSKLSAGGKEIVRQRWTPEVMGGRLDTVLAECTRRP